MTSRDHARPRRRSIEASSRGDRLTGVTLADYAGLRPAGGAVVTAVARSGCATARRERSPSRRRSASERSSSGSSAIRAWRSHITLASTASPRARSTCSFRARPRPRCRPTATISRPSSARRRSASWARPSEGRLFWDRWLQEYYADRVPGRRRGRADRRLAGSELRRRPAVIGSPRPPTPAPSQAPPAQGHRPARRLRQGGKAAAQPRSLLLAYVDADGFPVVVPVRGDRRRTTGESESGAAERCCPPARGARACSAHNYRREAGRACRPPAHRLARGGRSRRSQGSTRRTPSRGSARRRTRRCSCSRTACSPSAGCERRAAPRVRLRRRMTRRRERSTPSGRVGAARRAAPQARAPAASRRRPVSRRASRSERRSQTFSSRTRPKGGRGGDETYRLAGRLVARRGHGKAAFLDLEDRSGRIQLHARQDVLGEEPFARLVGLDLGDLIGVEGRPFVPSGESSRCESTDGRCSRSRCARRPRSTTASRTSRLRYRQRELDLIANPEARELFVLRTQGRRRGAALPRRARVHRGRDAGAAAALRRRARAAIHHPPQRPRPRPSTCGSRPSSI